MIYLTTVRYDQQRRILNVTIVARLKNLLITYAEFKTDTMGSILAKKTNLSLRLIMNRVLILDAFVKIRIKENIVAV